MVRDDPSWRFNVNDSYNHNMNLVGLIDQLQNLCQVEHWMCKYKWLWSISFLGHVLVLSNACIILKTLCEEGKVNPISQYKFWHLF